MWLLNKKYSNKNFNVWIHRARITIARREVEGFFIVIKNNNSNLFTTRIANVNIKENDLLSLIKKAMIAQYNYYSFEFLVEKYKNANAGDDKEFKKFFTQAKLKKEENSTPKITKQTKKKEAIMAKKTKKRTRSKTAQIGFIRTATVKARGYGKSKNTRYVRKIRKGVYEYRLKNR